MANPTYEQVCGKQTGHAEVVQVTFDPAVITFDDVLEAFFVMHDPTTLNRCSPCVCCRRGARARMGGRQGCTPCCCPTCLSASGLLPKMLACCAQP